MPQVHRRSRAHKRRSVISLARERGKGKGKGKGKKKAEILVPIVSLFRYDIPLSSEWTWMNVIKPVLKWISRHRNA